MKTDPITINRIRLVCDADGCGYEERIDEISPKFIGKACPNCGISLLTKEDYSAMLTSMAALNLLNAIAGPVEETEPKGPTFSINPRQENGADIDALLSGLGLQK